MIPEKLKKHLEQQVGHTVKNPQNVTGGSINQAAKVEVESIGTCFLKWNSRYDADMFAKEVHGLNLLQSAGTELDIPEVIEQGVEPETGTGYLLMEYIAEGRPQNGSARHFGQQLARLHQVTHDQFGLDYDNYIGRLPQPNTPHDDWIGFFINERMEYQLNMALDAGRFSKNIIQHFQNMYKKLPEIMPDEPASLLHGDLWGGNYMFDKKGKACIYDPAVYYGNREIELAFTHLFGGFSDDFYAAYNETWSLQKGFHKRIDIYNLYPLLVHTNMFGGSYARQVESIIRKF